MPTIQSDRLCEFAVALATAARLFTTGQLSKHPLLCDRSQPIKRASEFLRLYQDIFECSPGPIGCPHRWRLTATARRKLGVTWKAVPCNSSRVEHWLGVGDIWLDLTFHGGRPMQWVTEPDGQFDIYCVWRDVPYLIEYQRTPITKKQWQAKWNKRLTWYREQKWDVRPRVVLVNTTGQQVETLCLPRGTLLTHDIGQLHHVLTRIS